MCAAFRAKSARALRQYSTGRTRQWARLDKAQLLIYLEEILTKKCLDATCSTITNKNENAHLICNRSSTFYMHVRNLHLVDLASKVKSIFLMHGY